MEQPRVFITREIPQAGLEKLRGQVELDIWPGELPPPYETLLERARGAHGILSLLTDRIDAAVMDAGGPKLKVISQMAVGYDNIDVEAAAARGIQVGNTPGVLTETTADFAWALLMAAARRVVEGDRFTRAGQWKTWSPMGLLGQDVAGATLGIVGFGRIGQAVARRATGFGMRILYFDPQRQEEAERQTGAVRVDLDALLSAADFISLHTALTAETRHLIGAAQFQRMKPTAVLVNTARGGVIDPAALYQALDVGRIAAAAIDVTEQEPIAPDDPLLSLENLIITPHIASASVATRARMASMAAENLLAGLAGRALPYPVI